MGQLARQARGPSRRSADGLPQLACCAEFAHRPSRHVVGRRPGSAAGPPDLPRSAGSLAYVAHRRGSPGRQEPRWAGPEGAQCSNAAETAAAGPDRLNGALSRLRRRAPRLRISLLSLRREVRPYPFHAGSDSESLCTLTVKRLTEPPLRPTLHG